MTLGEMPCAAWLLRAGNSNFCIVHFRVDNFVIIPQWVQILFEGVFKLLHLNKIFLEYLCKHFS
jgi:hypothetical protein